MSTPAATAITLRAIEGEPLADPALEEMVVATARAIAERQGIRVLNVETDASSITVTLTAARIAAIGFAAELRRLTTAWYTGKYGARTLWGDQPPAASADDEAWRDG